MRAVIVADTGPLIALAKINHLHLLSQLYQEIILPQTVFEEATKEIHWQDALQIDNFVKNYAEVISNIKSDIAKELLLQLDVGESQAIALAHSLQCPVLLDERRGRIVAKQKKVEILGTIGLLITAKKEKMIPEISGLLQKISTNGYRISPALIQQALAIAGEN